MFQVGPEGAGSQGRAAELLHQREGTVTDHEVMTEAVSLTPTVTDVSFFTLQNLNVNCGNNSKDYWIML